ncbi:MAG: xanthine phosphoribosyltransferase [Firmicutes bacterium]|nr:xanthine phosphoribosyltransferase [Bacillota bacterium]
MKELEERILRDGKGIGTEILKVDSFLNHQLDVGLVRRMGEEFARLFAGSGANKILTVEASGLPIAFAAAAAMGDLPMVFAKKKKPSTMQEKQYVGVVHSFTKNTDSSIVVSKKYLGPEDKLLIIDDFLATGSAGMGLIDIARQAGAEVVGYGAAIEKEFQGGAEKLRAMGIEVHSLAVIKSIRDDNIQF